MSRRTVAVAMSGGVDSSVAAALLQEAGWTVVGMTMVVASGMRHTVANAQRVAQALNIEHLILDCTELFRAQVIEDFCTQYRSGRTPNPCIRCNDAVKFGFLREQAARNGADFFATGHYARIEASETSGLFRLLPGVDRLKDQSYFLYRLDQQRLGRILMPLGISTKEQIRTIARSKALPVPYDRESQDVCFLAGADYADFVREHLPGCAAPGPILDRSGRVLGSHRGLIHYTVGQRRGIGIAGPVPLYVLALDPERNALVVGEKEYLYGDFLEARAVHYVSGAAPDGPVRALVKIRYLHRPASAVVMPREGDRAQVLFDAPQLSITPGQSVVFYDVQENFVIGGGVIETAMPRNARQA